VTRAPLGILLLLLLAAGCGSTERSIAKGQSALQAGDPQAAAAAFTEALGRAPNRADAWLGRAQARLKAGDQAGALSDLRKAVTLDPKLTEGWRLLGAQEPDAKTRAAAWTHVLAEKPDDLDARRARGKERIALGDAKGATEDLSAWLETHADDQEAQGWYGEALLGVDRPYDAYDAFQKSLSPASNTPRALHLVKKRARSGDGKAMTFLARVGEPPDDYVDLAQTLYDSHRLQPALEEVRKALAVYKGPSPDRARALALSAAIREGLLDDPTFAATRGAVGTLERGRVLEDAIKQCDESLAIAPSPTCYRTEGKARMDLKQPARALQAFTKAIELDPTDVQARRWRTRVAENRKRWEIVVLDADALESEGKIDVELLIRRANAKDALDTFTEAQAKADLDKAVAMARQEGRASPELYTALKARGFFEANHNHPAEALADLKEAKPLRPMRDEELEERLALLEASQ